MDKLRILFEKKGRAIYISHLDLMRTLQRAFSRAGYSLLYSEGFNPHPQLSVLLPLSVGCASRCEILEFRLQGDTEDLARMPERLNKALPEGICILEAYSSLEKAKYLKYLRIEGRLEYDAGGLVEKAAALRKFFERDEIVITRRTKKGEGRNDIRPAIKEIDFSDDGSHVRLDAVISAQEPTLNPEHLINALRQLECSLTPDFAQFTRVEVCQENMEIFR